MEAIIAMSSLIGRTRFERSCLPPIAQLALHVDEVDFMGWVARAELAPTLLDQLAQAIHAAFCEDLRRQEIVWGEKTDIIKKTHCSLVDFDQLPEDEKAQNRDSARSLVNRLVAAGYTMIPSRRFEAPFQFSREEEEVLAEMEHERWLRMKLAAGWKWAEETDKAHKRHKDLVPWKTLSHKERLQVYEVGAESLGPGELAEQDKEKNRGIVRSTANVLASIRYTVTRL